MVPVALGLYGGTMVAAGTRVAARRGKPGLGPLVALAMSTMHVAYGAGCWWEFVRGATRDREEESG
jgi:hypothetical protein